MLRGAFFFPENVRNCFQRESARIVPTWIVPTGQPWIDCEWTLIRLWFDSESTYVFAIAMRTSAFMYSTCAHEPATKYSTWGAHEICATNKCSYWNETGSLCRENFTKALLFSIAKACFNNKPPKLCYYW